MSDMNPLSHRIEKIHGRLSELYRHAVASPSPSPELLPTALIELGIVSEALQLVMNELARQNERLASMQSNMFWPKIESLFKLSFLKFSSATVLIYPFAFNAITLISLMLLSVSARPIILVLSLD
jgi:hypothetical protein